MGTIFFKVMEMSIAALLLIVAVAVIRLPLRKAPKWFMGILWTIVALRLLVPVQITAHVGFMPDFGNIVNACFDGEKETAAEEGPVSVNGGIYETVGYTKDITALDAADNAEDKALVNGTADVVQAEEVAADTRSTSVVPLVVQIIWLIGMALVLGFGVYSYFRIKRKTAASIRYIDGDNVFVCDDIDTPFIFGIIRPRIYMPSGLSSKTITNVIAHEKAHLERFDHLRKQFGYIILAIHWFNPLVWLAYMLFCRDIELACDERVVKKMTLSQKKSYAHSLLSCSTQGRMVLAYPLAFGEIGVGIRVKQIFNYKKPTAWLVTGLVIICSVLATSSFTKAAEKEPIEQIPLIELDDVEIDVNANKASVEVKPVNSPDTEVKVYTNIEDVPSGESLYNQEQGTQTAKSGNGAANMPYTSETDRTAAKIPGNNGDAAYVEVNEGNEEVKVQVSNDNVNVVVKDGNETVNVNTSNPVMKEGETLVGDVLNEVDRMLSEDEVINQVVDETINEAYDEVVDEIVDEVFDEIIDEGLGDLFRLFP